MDDSYLDITQQPGVPYFINATMLGGLEIQTINYDNDIKIYLADEYIK